MKSKKTTIAKKPNKTQNQRNYDYQTDVPPLWLCDLCAEEYKLWITDSASWKLLPKRHQKWLICLDCFRQCLAERGHDPMAPKINYQPWQNLKKHWDGIRPHPAHVVKIEFPSSDEGFSESIWCEITALIEHDQFAVKLNNTSIFRADTALGTAWLAQWDGLCIDADSGRPMLRAIEPLSK